MTARAVLVGINEYADPVVPDLHGCVNDSASGVVPRGAYVLVAGCLDEQTSKETDFDGRRNGALTHFLSGALREPDTTLRAAFTAAADGVRGAVEEQDPVLEGPDARLDAAPF